jgi:L-aminopeptidase/D-esterase-like protein
VELLKPVRLAEKIHAILLTGGSAFGLNAAGGVQQYLEERNIGYDVGVAKVPLVPAAVIFDLGIGDPGIRPDVRMGYKACLSADAGICPEGQVGVGIGATVGKVQGPGKAVAGGVGTWAEFLPGGTVVGGLIVCNCFGDVIHPGDGRILAGPKDQKGNLQNSLELLKENPANPFARPGVNTTLGVVATNALLNKEQATKVAQMAHSGVSRTTRPAHTLFDGDMLFAMSVGENRGDVTVIGACAAEVIARAVMRSVGYRGNGI